MVKNTAKEIPSISKEIEYVVKEGPPSSERFSVVHKGIASIQIGKKIIIPKCLEIHISPRSRC
jgi:hypothetical protein